MLKLFALLAFAIMFVWTWLTGREEVPITGRTQVIAVSEEEAARLGARAYEQAVSQYPMIGEGPDSRRVLEITSRIASEAEEVIGADYDWRAALLSSRDINAFALPGGKIAVFQGMLAVADTDDELAAVIAHEIAHVVARHGSERITQQQLAEMGQMAVGVALGDMDPATRAAVLGALGVGAQFGVLMPFSRVHEAEADQIGLVLMARACYDPRAAPRLWRDMARAARGQAPEFLSTHPSHGSRIEALEARMDEALREYREAGCPPLEGA